MDCRSRFETCPYFPCHSEAQRGISPFAERKGARWMLCLPHLLHPSFNPCNPRSEGVEIVSPFRLSRHML